MEATSHFRPIAVTHGWWCTSSVSTPSRQPGWVEHVLQLRESVGRLDERVTGVDTRMERLEGRMDRLEARMDRLADSLERVQNTMYTVLAAQTVGFLGVIATILATR